MQSGTQKEALAEARRRAGSDSALARIAGVSRQAVNNWTRIPPEHVLVIERELGISRYVARPDVFGTDEDHPPNLERGRADGGSTVAAPDTEAGVGESDAPSEKSSAAERIEAT